MLKMKSVLPVVLVMSSMPAWAATSESPEQAQIKFITDFYHGILDGQGADRKDTPFFSKSLEKRLDEDHKACAEKSRGDDICGADADTDIYTNSQDSGPGLNFKNSEFKAKSVGKNLIEASFTLSPGDHDYYARKFRFKMTQEGDKWRVDDLLTQLRVKSGKLEFISLRDEIRSDLEHLENVAKDLSDAASWVMLHLETPDELDRVSKFTAFPVTLCEKKNSCAPAPAKDDSRFKAALQKLNEYYGYDSNSKKNRHPFPGPKDFGKKESKNPKPNQAVPYGPFTFTYQNGAWWVTKIDLSVL
jgi:hypothetical protein